MARHKKMARPVIKIRQYILEKEEKGADFSGQDEVPGGSDIQEEWRNGNDFEDDHETEAETEEEEEDANDEDQDEEMEYTSSDEYDEDESVYERSGIGEQLPKYPKVNFEPKTPEDLLEELAEIARNSPEFMEKFGHNSFLLGTGLYESS